MRDELNELQRDALIETINIGVGRASRALSKLAQSEVAMSVPIVIDGVPDGVAGLVAPELFQCVDVCAVSRRVLGLDAEVVLIFQATQEAVTAIVAADALSQEHSAAEPRQEALSKIGYLVIESCLDQIENVLGRGIDREPLRYHPRLPASIFSSKVVQADPAVIIKIDLTMPRRGLSGHLLCALTQEAANHLADGLDAMVRESEG